MKRTLFLLVAIVVGVMCSYAIPEPTNSGSNTSSYSQASVYYDGRAYSAAQDGLVPSADGSVSIYWTSDDCSVNGNSGYQVYKISGGTFTMRVNGKTKSMTHYVNYGGERYYFQL